MTEKHLTLNQHLALLPVAIPDSVLDLLEDFNYDTALQTEGARAALDPEYLRDSGETLKKELEAVRNGMGKVISLQVEAAGRNIPGAYLCKIGFEKGVRGLGIMTKLKDKTVLRVVIPEGEYAENSIRQMLQNSATGLVQE